MQTFLYFIIHVGSLLEEVFIFIVQKGFLPTYSLIFYKTKCYTNFTHIKGLIMLHILLKLKVNNALMCYILVGWTRNCTLNTCVDTIYFSLSFPTMLFLLVNHTYWLGRYLFTCWRWQYLLWFYYKCIRPLPTYMLFLFVPLPTDKFDPIVIAQRPYFHCIKCVCLAMHEQRT